MREYDALLPMLEEHGALLKEIRDEVRLTNGRVRRLEIVVAVLKWAVFVVGPSSLAALGYLYVRHMAF